MRLINELLPLDQLWMTRFAEKLAELSEVSDPLTTNIPQTDNELWDYVAKTWGVQIPRQAVCPGHVAPFTAFADAYFARDSMIVWEASRGLGGKSFMLSILGLTIATTRGGDVNILGGSGEQSKRVHDYMGKAWDKPEAPRHLLRSDPMKTVTHLSKGNTIQALLASSASVRGPHINTLLLDECLPSDTQISTPSGSVPIAMLVPGDKVLSLDEYGDIIPSIVSAMKCTGEKQTIRLHFEHGMILAATRNHPILTTDGWKHAGEITAGDSCVAMPAMWRRDLRPISQQDWSVPQMLDDQARRGSPQVYGLRGEACQPEASAVHALPESLPDSPAFILSRLWQADCQDSWSQAMSCLSLQAQSSKGLALHRLWDATQATYGTLQTLPPQVYEQRADDYPYECRSGHRAQKRPTLKSRIALRGTSIPLGQIVSNTSASWTMDTRFCPRGRQDGHRSARRVLASTRVKHRARYSQAPSSRGKRIPGYLPHDRATAPLVRDTLASVRVVSVESGPSVPVYNLTVEHTHNYIANGIIVHNCDEMDLKIFDAAMGQTMPIGGLPAVTVMSSTHHYPNGTFTEILKRAASKSWTHFCWCYRESMAGGGWLTPETVAQKQYETTSAMWETEYELQEPSPESRAIMPDAVKAMFDRRLGVYEGKPREYIEAEAPVEGATYAHGADWAKSVDWTEIVTIRTDVTPARLVAYERLQRLPWPQMVQRFEERQRHYGLARSRAAHDGTGLGDVIDGYLTQDAEKVVLVGRTRSDLFSNHISGIENGALVSPYIESLFGQYLYCSVDDLYGSAHPPDGFVAGAMAWYAKSLPPKQKWLPVDW